ncbi:hypothetical protein GQ44DRAFT_729415 [Phaeosphaeriaceae sp. PMI808]|nr:hypothetical protein GQ44DRAFT_729415 [Phaeosphaeriaceae sp. PMI808]
MPSPLIATPCFSVSLGGWGGEDIPQPSSQNNELWANPRPPKQVSRLHIRDSTHDEGGRSETDPAHWEFRQSRERGVGLWKQTTPRSDYTSDVSGVIGSVSPIPL